MTLTPSFLSWMVVADCNHLDNLFHTYFSFLLTILSYLSCLTSARSGHRPQVQEAQLVSSSHASDPYKPVTKSPHCVVDPLQPEFNNVVHHTKVDVFTSPYAQSASCFTTVVHHTKVGAFTKSPHCVVDPLQPEFKTTSFTTQRWTSSPVPTRRARPGSPPSFTIQRWAPSPIARHHTKVDVFTNPYAQSASCFTTRRPHAMGVFTSSSPTCYGRRHQFINIFRTRGRVLSERIQSTIRVVPQLRLWSRRIW